MTWWKYLVAAALVTVVAGTALYWVPHAVPMSSVAQVTPGKTREEAVALLGTPSDVTQYSDGRVKISYSKPFRYCVVEVFVDSSGRVTGLRHDH